MDQYNCALCGSPHLTSLSQLPHPTTRHSTTHHQL
jgi:hypothetical protein